MSEKARSVEPEQTERTEETYTARGASMDGMSRRGFLGAGLAAGAAVLAGPMVWVPKARASWAPKSQVHPQVDQLLVVGVTDVQMTRGLEPSCGWSRQEELVVPQRIFENMDRLACALSGLKDPVQAWKQIFVKPPGKPWSEVVVAIKTNNIALQHTRSPVLAKVCRVLVDFLGVKPHNINVYDAIHGSGMSKSTPFKGLPEGVRIQDAWDGITAPTVVPAPWRQGTSKSKCIPQLVEGSVDILVNIALCKGHSSRFGGFTMSMKNHFGTFSPRPGHEEGSEDYLISINKTAEILGPMDSKTGKVLFPRQQLCVLDGLWASKGGPGGNPTHQPNFLAMGVFSPVLDYLIATCFRGGRMGWKPEPEMTERMLSDFGYSPSDLPQGGKILELS